MRSGPITLALIVVALLAGLVYSGLWQTVVLFVWQHPMLSWVPILVAILVSVMFRLAHALSGGNLPATATAGAISDSGELTTGDARVDLATIQPQTPAVPVDHGRRTMVAFFAGLIVFLAGLFFTLIAPPAVGLSDIEYEFVDSLPERTQPRLLPRSAVSDDPRFADAKEIHLTRDPTTGELTWTGEWQAPWLSGPSEGVVVKSLDAIVAESQLVRAGFDHSVSGWTPGTLKWQAKAMHPFSRVQYPVLIPTGEDEAIAMAPYVGYRGFPFRTPYLKGVLVYHQDGEIEDLSPEEAAERAELAASGRIVPESVARAQAEALASSDELSGRIVDGEGNRQPFLTAIDSERTVWMTVINDEDREGGVKAVVLSDSTTGETEVWRADGETRLVSTRDVLNEARALPLTWKERRCCDSDGHSYTVTLREVVEPRLAFKNGHPYYMVTVVPTNDLALSRDVEYTLLIDAETGETLTRFAHAEDPAEDRKLERFFR